MYRDSRPRASSTIFRQRRRVSARYRPFPRASDRHESSRTVAIALMTPAACAGPAEVLRRFVLRDVRHGSHVDVNDVSAHAFAIWAVGGHSFFSGRRRRSDEERAPSSGTRRIQVRSIANEALPSDPLPRCDTRPQRRAASPGGETKCGHSRMATMDTGRRDLHAPTSQFGFHIGASTSHGDRCPIRFTDATRRAWRSHSAIASDGTPRSGRDDLDHMTHES